MPDSRPIRDVVVAGGGIVGWSAAAALRRHLPNVGVTVIADAPAPDALAERIGSTLPSIAAFHGDLGLSEMNAVARTASGYRVGTQFEGWAGNRPAYVHTYGEHGRPFGATSFHLYWHRVRQAGGTASFDTFSPAAELARMGRFVHPQGGPGSILASFEYGLQLNPARYLDLMRAFAVHLGAREHQAKIAQVDVRGEDGFVGGLRLDDGQVVTADLFVDCTGPAARIRSALDAKFEDWSCYLPCDRVILAEGTAPASLPVMDSVVAMSSGWRWQAASPARTSHGLVYASAHLSDSKAERALRVHSGAEPRGPAVAIRIGRRPDPWLRNCVAVGEAAVALEPLEWTNLHVAHSAIDRIVAMMPDRECAPIELAEFNRQSAAEAERIRDFLMLHYVTSDRREPFWRDAAAMRIPDGLAHTLRLFRERGRLPFQEEETFARDSWLSVLFGQGVLPHRADPLTDALPIARIEAAMGQMRDSIRAMASPLPTHADYLGNMMRRAVR
ncbi:tryptophan halogenase family protein [Allosphingosinicella deserti]|uniref:tryptophan halogenase family protein n=1 Tax=Allosphingosinicella deserti TaxID=2116704 RepID=UPI001E332007|nr:tryptophan halogenase family protein [Sphingomonas deserti]